jgi:nitroreductase
MEGIMDDLKAILSRRSIRKYTGEQINDKRIEELLEAAMSAPSAGNEQPWHFVIIRDRNLLDSIPSFHPHSLMIRDAHVAILVCADTTLQKYKGYWVQDCSAATENILLAAHILGLGSVWLGVYPLEDRVVGFRKLLGIPEHIIPFSLIPVGHPAEQIPPSNRFDSKRIHYEQW